MDPVTVLCPHFDRAPEYAGAWAIEPRYAARLEEFAQTLTLKPKALAKHMAANDGRAVESTMTLHPTGDGRSVAIVRAHGMLMKQQSSLGASTSTIQLRRDIRKAATDPQVSAILLSIDSPGGAVNGTEALANDIRDARKAKPVIGQIEDLGASAAYWLAASTDKVYASNRTAEVGSIGTYRVVRDMSAAAEKEGVKVHVFATGPLKGMGTPGAPVTDAHAADFQRNVEATQAVFDAAVMEGRRLTPDQLAGVRTGGLFLAEEAHRLGLIDGIQSLDTTLSQLAGTQPGKRASAIPPDEGNPPDPGKGASTMNFEQYCKDRGIVAANLTEVQLANHRKDFEALYKAPVAPPVKTAGGDGSSLGGDLEAYNANALRLAQVRDLCAEYGNPRVAIEGKSQSVEAHAIERKWSLDKVKDACELAKLRDGRPVNSGVAIPNLKHSVEPNQLFACALAQSLKLPNHEKDYPDVVQQSAHDAFKGRLGLQELLLRTAKANGWRSDAYQVHDGNLQSVLKWALPEQDGPMAAAFSTIGISGILSNIANKFLLLGFMNVENVWQRISATRPVKDFKTVTSYRMTGAFEFTQVGPSGKLEHGDIGEETYTNAANTYGRMFAIPRTTIINDDLNAFADLPRRIGRGAGLKFNTVFWTAFMDNSSFFTSGNKNYFSGASTNLQSSSLQTAVQTFRDQVDSDGKPLAIQPQLLLTPTALEIPAWELVKSPNVVGPTSSKQPSANAFQGRFELLTSAYLGNSSFTGYSVTAWYLLADPMDLPTIEACFLNGNQSPTIETAEADFDVLGIQMRGFFDFGVAKQDPRGGVKSKGAA